MTDCVLLAASTCCAIPTAMDAIFGDLGLTAPAIAAYIALHISPVTLETPMTKAKPSDPKLAALRQHGCLNPHPQKVADPIFTSSDFFDARDLVQVKYEMVRRVRVDGQPVSHSAATYGFSRPSFYQAQRVLYQGGLAALVPRKPGPRRSHKLSADVMEFLQRERSTDPSLRPPDLAGRVLARFGRKVHPRSVERALVRQEKKRR